MGRFEVYEYDCDDKKPIASFVYDGSDNFVYLYSYPSDDRGCSGGITSYLWTVTGVENTDWQWVENSNQNDENPVIEFLTDGSFTVTLVITTGCGTSDPFEQTFNDGPCSNISDNDFQDATVFIGASSSLTFIAINPDPDGAVQSVKSTGQPQGTLKRNGVLETTMSHVDYVGFQAWTPDSPVTMNNTDEWTFEVDVALLLKSGANCSYEYLLTYPFKRGIEHDIIEGVPDTIVY